MFTEIELHNWRNFKRVRAPLGRRLFVVGPNAAGKSNFLDAFRFLRDVAEPEGGLQRAIESRGGVSHLRSLYARQNPAVKIAVVCRVKGDGTTETTWSYELEITQNKKKDKQPKIKSEVVRKNGAVLRERPDAQDQEDPERLTQTLLEQVNENREFRALVAFLASTRYLHIVPQLIRQPERATPTKDDAYGSDFLERLVSVSKRTRESRLKKINEALRVAVPEIAELRVEKDPMGIPHLEARMQHWRPNAGWQQEHELSDGTLRLLGLLWALLDEPTAPLLLEEPELSLHTAIVRRVPQMMARVARKTGRQVLVSTHSADLLDDEGIAPDEILMLIPGKEETIASLAAEDESVRSLLEAGVRPAEVVLERVFTGDASQLALFSA